MNIVLKQTSERLISKFIHYLQDQIIFCLILFFKLNCNFCLILLCPVNLLTPQDMVTGSKAP